MAIALIIAGLSETRFLRRGTVWVRWVVLLLGVGSLTLLRTLLLTRFRGSFAGLAAALPFMAVVAWSRRPVMRVTGALALRLLDAG